VLKARDPLLLPVDRPTCRYRPMCPVLLQVAEPHVRVCCAGCCGCRRRDHWSLCADQNRFQYPHHPCHCPLRRPALPSARGPPLYHPLRRSQALALWCQPRPQGSASAGAQEERVSEQATPSLALVIQHSKLLSHLMVCEVDQTSLLAEDILPCLAAPITHRFATISGRSRTVASGEHPR